MTANAQDAAHSNEPTTANATEMVHEDAHTADAHEADAHTATDAHHGAEAGHEEGGFNASEVIFGHIADSYDWHFLDINHKPVSIPLPVIAYKSGEGLSVFSSSKLEHGHAEYNGYKLVEDNSRMVLTRADGQDFLDLSITKNVASMLISFVIILALFLTVAKSAQQNGSKKAPKGLQNAMEPLITFVRDEIAKPNLGHKYMKFMPFLLTVFFFIWVNNLLGLIPGGANFTGNIAVTLALASCTFVAIVFSANKDFWAHIFNFPGVPFPVKILLAVIELLSLFIKPVALTIRLFANILAGHIIILSIVSMIFIFGGLNEIAGWGFAPISVAFSIFMFCLELLVAAVQAYIFTNLSAVFIGQAVEEHEHHDDHAHAH